jgi:hypothetical protein
MFRFSKAPSVANGSQPPLNAPSGRAERWYARHAARSGKFPVFPRSPRMNSLFRKTKFPDRFTEAWPQVVDSALQSLVHMVRTGRNFAEFPDKFPVLREFGPSEAYSDRLIPSGRARVRLKAKEDRCRLRRNKPIDRSRRRPAFRHPAILPKRTNLGKRNEF